MRASGRKHVVKLSALGGRESMFPSGHRDSEENIEASGLPCTFLRPNGFMQNLVNYHTGTVVLHSRLTEQLNPQAVMTCDRRQQSRRAGRAAGPGSRDRAVFAAGTAALLLSLRHLRRPMFEAAADESFIRSGGEADGD